MPCVVALPRVGVSTPMAFREWDAAVRRACAWLDTRDGSLVGLEELSLAYSSAYALSRGWRSPKPGTSGIVSRPWP